MTTGRYYVPFFRVTEIAYPNGLKNILVTALTPIDDRNTRASISSCCATTPKRKSARNR